MLSEISNTTNEINFSKETSSDIIRLLPNWNNPNFLEAIKNPEILRRIEEVENGAELFCFNEEEFEELNKKLLLGIKPDISKIRKTKK